MNSRNALLGLILAATSAVACSDSRRDDVLAQDSSLARDLALANQDTVSLPQLADVPAAPTPSTEPSRSEPEAVTPAPRPKPSSRAGRAIVRDPVPAAPRQAETRPDAPRVTGSGNTETVNPGGSERALGVVSAGAEISLASGERVCTSSNRVGDRFNAQTSTAVMGANGTVIPAGATAVVSISSLKKSERAGDEIEIGLRVESITFDGRTYAVTSETTYAEVDRVRVQSRSDDVKKVATGAAIGAVIGQILGGRTKSTVIGAATGAAAGAVVASRNADYDGCLPNGGSITIRLSEPLTIQRT